MKVLPLRGIWWNLAQTCPSYCGGRRGRVKQPLARIAARLTESEFYEISAVNAGVADIRKVIEECSSKPGRRSQKGTVLFIDEIHRFNKAQQDAVLPHIENGTDSPDR